MPNWHRVQFSWAVFFAKAVLYLCSTTNLAARGVERPSAIRFPQFIPSRIFFSVGKIRGKRENVLRLGSEGRVNAVHSGFHEGLVRLDYLPDAQGVARISSQGRQCLVSPCLAGCLTENTQAQLETFVALLKQVAVALHTVSLEPGDQV